MSNAIALAYLKWAEEHASGKVQILIADEIAQFNYLACSHSTKPGALSRAIRDGDKYHTFFDEIIGNLQNRSLFNIVRWHAIKNERFYWLLNEVTLEFETNTEFKNAIITIANEYLMRRSKIIQPEKTTFVYQYLLHELPTLLDGIYVDDTHCHLILYPTYRHSGMSNLVSDIQNGIRFQALRDRLKLKKTIMVEWLIEDKKDQQIDETLLLTTKEK